MKKIVILGCPGSGKSRLARLLGECTGIPVHHLDRIWWKNAEEHVSRPEFDAELARILSGDEWIADGDYSRTYEVRIMACDTVLFLDFSAEQCLQGIREREGLERDDCPISKSDDSILLEVGRYAGENRPAVLALLEKYHGKTVHIFRSREEADAWLDALRKHGE